MPPIVSPIYPVDEKSTILKLLVNTKGPIIIKTIPTIKAHLA